MSETSLVQVEVKRTYPSCRRIITAREHPRVEPLVVAFEQIGHWAVVDRRDDLPAVLVESETAALAIVESLAAKAVNA